MTETEKKYDAIRRAYPETISKDQFYRIAHISKATALHLLQNGLVPCKDTGKKNTPVHNPYRRCHNLFD